MDNRQLTGEQKATAVMFLAVVAAAVIFFGHALRQDAHDNSAPAVSDGTSVYPVSADDLLDAYKDNEVRADQQFSGKVLAVTGSVASVEKNGIDNSITLNFLTKRFEYVEAFLASGQDAAAAKLTKGERVTVRCRSAGVSGTVYLRGCILD